MVMQNGEFRQTTSPNSYMSYNAYEMQNQHSIIRTPTHALKESLNQVLIQTFDLHLMFASPNNQSYHGYFDPLN